MKVKVPLSASFHSAACLGQIQAGTETKEEGKDLPRRFHQKSIQLMFRNNNNNSEWVLRSEAESDRTQEEEKPPKDCSRCDVFGIKQKM